MPPTPPRPPADPPEYFEQPPTGAAAPEPPVARGRRKLSRRASLIGTVLALLVAVGLAWLAWDLTRPEQTTSARGGRGGPGGGGFRGATTVGVAKAELADIPVFLDALGTVVPRATVRIRPQVNGVMTQVLFKEGQMVKRGQLLATIDARPFELALQQAVGQRMRDEAQLAAARVTLARYETLLKQDSIARQDVDTQRATVHQLEAAVVSDKAQEGSARLNVSYTRIVAPVAGRIGLRNVDVGNQVSTSDTNGIAVVTTLTPIEVQFAIPQDNASWLQHNAGAFMEVKAYDRTKTTLLDTGVFASLDNQIDTTTGTVRAKARFNNARLQLFPSQFVNVQLQVRTITDAVVVPVTAVRPSGTGEFVFVLQQDHTVKQRSVVRGQPFGDRVQIASGLQAGETVITEGADRLRDGSRVILPGEQPSGPGAAGGGRRGQHRTGGAGAPDGAASASRGAASEAPASNPFSGASAAQAPASGAAALGAGQGLNAEQRAARAAAWQKLTPEERAARRQRRGAAAANAATPE
jgi:multidrug efflux system membrane fusion protein